MEPPCVKKNTFKEIQLGYKKASSRARGGKAEYIQYIIKHGFGKTVVSNNASRTIS